MEIETAMTYLEHERRGKCGEYEIAYIGEQVLHADDSNEARWITHHLVRNVCIPLAPRHRQEL